MATDPICGMDVSEIDAQHMLHVKGITVYFCSPQCKETYAKQSGNVTDKRPGVFRRFLEKLAKRNEQDFGDQPPKCH